MSLLPIVLLLDESHLELVEDVLKETNFNDKDWEQLGQELRIYDWSDRNFLKLKQCLSQWLRASLPPTLADLADALKRIGYKRAGGYIIKTCKLIKMFNDQCY